MSGVNQPTHHYTEHIPALDGLRGYAAAMVVFYHAILLVDESLMNRVLIPPFHAAHGAGDFATKTALTFFSGSSAVVLFYILSGLVLHQSLLREPALDGRTAGLFLVRRVLRIFPALIATIGGMWAVHWVVVNIGRQLNYPAVSLKDAILNALLFKISVHGPSGSVQAEALATPFILALAFLHRRFTFMASLLLVCASVFAMEWRALVFHWPFLDQTLFAFWLGMMLALPEARPVFAKIGTAGMILAFIGGWAGRMCLSMTMISGIVGQIIFIAVLVGAVRYGNPQSAAHRFLTRPFSQTLGRISYSFYLWNVLFLMLVFYTPVGLTWTPHLPPLPAVKGTIIGGFVCLLTFPVALASEKFIERPFIHWGRWLTRHAKPEAAHA